MKKRRAKNAVPGGERIFQRIYTRLGCEGRPPHFVVEFHPYTDLTHTIRLREDTAYVRLSDALDDAPHPVVEATAAILLGRLYRREPPRNCCRPTASFPTREPPPALAGAAAAARASRGAPARPARITIWTNF